MAMSSGGDSAKGATAQQRRGIRITIALIIAVMVVFFSLFLHKILQPRILSADQLQVNRAIVFDAPRIIKPFTLLDHHGEAFTAADLAGKWSLIYFGFTHCPDICPTTLAQLSKVVKILESPVREQTQVLMVTVDPARDTQQVLSSYMTYFDPSFIGVTGEFVEIMSFSRNLNVAFSKVMLDDGYTVDHTGHLVLINPEGHYHGFFKPPFELATLKLTLQSIVLSY